MDHIDAMSVPLMRVAPTFYKERTFWGTRLTSDDQFRDIGSIDNLDYNPTDNHYDQLLVTSLARMSMYDSNTFENIRTYKTNTQYQVYGGCFRKNDGRLIAAGSEEGKIFIFESHNPSPLRTFNLKAPTHRVLFMENHNTLVTFSDDRAMRIIDIGTGSTTCSSSYDNTVKFWDPRCDDLKPVMEYNHGYPVEGFCTRRDTFLISVGGNKLHVFDMIAGKTLTSLIPKHHKTITCVSNYDDKYLLTGALDGYLNILNFNYEYVTRFNYEDAQILSLVANPKLLAVGFNNHKVNVKKFKDFMEKSNSEMAEYEKIQSGYFGPNMVTRYIHDQVGTQHAFMSVKRKKTPVVLDDASGLYDSIELPKLIVARPVKRRNFTKYLRMFQHSQALDVALRTGTKYDPSDVIYVLNELIRRDKLRNAFADCRRPVFLMRFLSTQLGDTRHNRLALDCSLVLIDLFLNDKSLIQHNNPMFWKAVDQLFARVCEELNVFNCCVAISAQLNTVIY